MAIKIYGKDKKYITFSQFGGLSATLTDHPENVLEAIETIETYCSEKRTPEQILAEQANARVEEAKRTADAQVEGAQIEAKRLIDKAKAEAERQIDAIIAQSQSVLDQYKETYREWTPGEKYSYEEIITYNGKLYKVIYQAEDPHTAQAHWKPDEAHSMYEEYLPDDVVLPYDPNTIYRYGQRMIAGGKVYESTIENNVWSVEAYPRGWRLIEET